MVGAGAHLVHQIGIEVQAKVLPLRLADGDGAHIARRGLQLHMGQGIIAIKPVIQHIHNGMAVDGQKLFAHLDTGPLRGAVPVNGGDDGAHRCVLSCETAYRRIITTLL